VQDQEDDRGVQDEDEEIEEPDQLRVGAAERSHAGGGGVRLNGPAAAIRAAAAEPRPTAHAGSGQFRGRW